MTARELGLAPAFPNSYTRAAGMTTRLWLASQLVGKVEFANDTAPNAEAELGIPAGTYDYRKHYVVLLSRRALKLADALLEESMR